METVLSVLFVPVFLWLAWRSVTRRPGMTATERQLEDQSRELRKLRKEVDRQRWA